MPEFTKVSHYSFSARDKEKSAAWLTEALGFEEFDRVTEDGWSCVLLIHPPTATIIEYQQHDANAGETFDPTRTGLDHVGFLVKDRAALDEWKAHFERLGVTHSAISDRDYGGVLCFKDPDGIQYEMFAREGHP